MDSKAILFTLLLIGATSTVKAETFNITCTFRQVFWDVVSCQVEDVVIPDDESLDIAFVGEHLPGWDNSRIRWVEMWSSDIPFIVTQMFTTFPNLEYVVHGTNLLRIQENAFANAANLRRLEISWAPQLKTIDENAFAGATRLDWLQIFRCGIETIDENAFNGLSALNQLELQDLEIRELPPNVFRPLPALEVLWMSWNSLEKLDGRLFAHKPDMRIITLNHNRINAVERNFLDNLLRLRDFGMSLNLCVDKVWRIGFEGLTINRVREDLRECFDNFGPEPEEEEKRFVIELTGHLEVFDENGTEIMSL